MWRMNNFLSRLVCLCLWVWTSTTTTTITTAFTITTPSVAIRRWSLSPTTTTPTRTRLFMSDGAQDDEPVATQESQQDIDDRKKVNRPRHTIFVGNLPFDASDSAVRELFEPHGTVQLVSVPRNKETGQPRGFAFVDMSSDEEVTAAVAATDGLTFEGRMLRVNKSLPKAELSQQSKKESIRKDPEGSKKIYVGNIPFETTKDQLFDLYEEFGEVMEVYVPVDRSTGNGRGFAFVTMKEEDVETAIAQTNGLDFEGRKLVVSVPLPPGEKSKSKAQARTSRVKLYVGNLSFYTIPETLTQLFEEFGTVHDCYLPEDPASGGSRGFGFVTMDKDDGLQAIQELDGCEIDGRIIRVNEAQPKRSSGGGSNLNDDAGDGFADDE